MTPSRKKPGSNPPTSPDRQPRTLSGSAMLTDVELEQMKQQGAAALAYLRTCLSFKTTSELLAQQAPPEAG